MATDFSLAMVEETRRLIEAEGWTDMQTGILDVRSLSTLADDTCTHAVINMGSVVPGDPESGSKVTREVFRVLKPGGVAVLSTWAGKSPFAVRRHDRMDRWNRTRKSGTNSIRGLEYLL